MTRHQEYAVVCIIVALVLTGVALVKRDILISTFSIMFAVAGVVFTYLPEEEDDDGDDPDSDA